MRRVSFSRVALLVLFSARCALLCVCPGQYPTCDRQTGWCSGDTYEGHPSYLTGCTEPGTWCATYYGMILGSDCTEDFVPLPPIPWQRARILLSHWNDEAENLLERASFAIYPPEEYKQLNVRSVERHRRYCEVLHSWNLSECRGCRFMSPRVAPHPPVLHREDLEALMLHDDRAEVTIVAIRGTVWILPVNQTSSQVTRGVANPSTSERNSLKDKSINLLLLSGSKSCLHACSAAHPSLLAQYSKASAWPSFLSATRTWPQNVGPPA